jgi:5-methylcytosine-specific restriction endonuclease McrA
MAKSKSHRELGTQKWKDQRLRVLKRDGYICAYCGQEANQVDHVIARARGGGHDLDNLVACCARCNSLKGAKESGSFLGGSSTPPAFPNSISPMTTSTVLAGPLTSQTKQDE